MDYHKKYIKYNIKCLELSDKINENENKNQTGGNFICNPNERFGKMCVDNSNGEYKTKDACVDTCKVQYINKHLKKSNLKKETTQFYNLIKELLAVNINIYIKGGTVLGLLVLREIYEQTKKNSAHNKGDSWNQYFTEYLKLNLVRDWDFACYTNDVKITEEYRTKLDAIAAKYNMVPRAKTFILYQTKRPIQLDKQALFELAILEEDDNINSELPMTTIKVKVTPDNVYHIFMLANCFYLHKIRGRPMDYGFIKYAIKNIDFIIPKHKQGLYVMDRLYTGAMSDQLVKFIKNFAGSDLNLQQFLVTHFIEPHRMFYRLLVKNIPKATKINLFYQENKLVKNNTEPKWLINPIYIQAQIQLFVEKMSSHIYTIYLDNQSDPNKAISNLDDFFEGVNLNRIQIEYDNINCVGKSMIKTLFERIYKDLLIKDISSKLVKLLFFLNKSKLFE